MSSHQETRISFSLSSNIRLVQSPLRSVSVSQSEDEVVIPQTEINVPILSKSEGESTQIPVILNHFSRSVSKEKIVRPSFRQTIKRSNKILESPPLFSQELPTVMNLNPRSIYNRLEELSIIINQYNISLAGISESWERENQPLNKIIQIENFKVLTNAVQRSNRGGKPALLIDESKYVIRELCPKIITVPIGIEAVWALIRSKCRNRKSKINWIAVCCFYYPEDNISSRTLMYDHMAESINLIKAKYKNVHFLLLADSNKLDLSPILNMSEGLVQVVDIPTRLNPPATLDTIMTDLSSLYRKPVTKPPINSDNLRGKPSDHLIVLLQPLPDVSVTEPREYQKVEFRPVPESGLAIFREWLVKYDWSELYKSNNINFKAEYFQKILLDKFHEIFPIKIMKSSADDQPWFNCDLKKKDRARKREFFKNQKSEHWKKLNLEFLNAMKKAKISYRENMVDDIKNTHPSQWYSKVRRMSGLQKDQNCSVFVDELAELTDKDQAQKIADFFSSTRNLYRRVEFEDFPDFSNQNCQNFAENLVTPKNIEDVIKNLNQKSSCIFDDLPMKIINCLSTELSKPLCNIINSIFELGSYPQIWKREVITPVPKSYPSPTINKLRPISGILNFAKVADKLIADLITSDMSESKDNYQYGNEKGLYVNHYLINMINTILKSVDKNSQSERMSTLLTMVDWSQAFERQSHVLGIESFIKNGVRISLIPVLISFY